MRNISAFEGFLDWYSLNYNNFFWLIFIAAAFTFIAGIMLQMNAIFYFQILIGALIITTGVHRLGSELSHRRLRKASARVDRDLDEMIQWMTKSHDYTLAFKTRHEARLHHLDTKRASLEKRFDNHADIIAKKMIELENKMNKSLKRAERDALVLEKIEDMAKRMLRDRELLERRLLDVSARQLKAIRYVADKRKITNKEYRDLFKISEKSAYNELRDLEVKGIIVKKGSGRKTHYLFVPTAG